MTRAGLLLLVLTAGCAPPRSRSDVDPHIAAVIERTRAIDNHAHPAWDPNDHEFDALPVEAMEPAPGPARLDAANPEFKIERPARDATGVLDAAGIEVMFANRVAMGAGLDPARFKWVPFADALMYPLDNQAAGRRDPDRKAFFAAEEKLLARYLKESGLTAAPAAFADYLAFVTKTLERQHKNGGAVAEKFEMSYLRSLSVGAPAKAEAERVYSSRQGSSTALEDYLFRHIATECGRLGMPVHIHAAAGAGGYFDVGGANPMLLEPLFNDPAMRKTQFVVIHGGWPWTREATALMTKSNVWLDVSVLGLLLYPRNLAEVLRPWLEMAPDKVLFGTDSGPFGPGVGFDQTARVSARTVREALGLALTAMMRDNEISFDRAGEIARMVLRDNARRLYGWK